MPGVERDARLAAAYPPAVQVYALGGFRVVVGGHPVEENAWRRRTARQLFKCLLSRPNRRMTRDEVIELLWAESDPEAASSNLRSTIHAMRRVLEPSDAIGMVFGDRDSIWLRPDVELWLDADEFERSTEHAWRSPDPLPLLDQATALYAGHYLPDDLYEDWAAERRESLKQQWAELQIRLSHELERRGDPEAATRPLQRLLQLDPCDERAAQEAMQLLARNGRRSDALRVYRHLVQSLADELGIEPSTESVAIHLHISAGDIPSSPAPSSYRCAYPFPAPAELIGRETELALLERLMVRGRSEGQAALIGAPAGTGKSALVGQLVQLAQSRGVLCLAGGCYEERGSVPLGPFHDALVDFLLTQPPERIRADLGNSVDDLAQVVPEVRYHLNLADPVAPSPSPVDRMRAFGAIHACLRSLAQRGPLLVCLEDLHAADEATLQLFHYLARQTRRLPLVLVATYRNDEARADEPLAQTIAALMRERLVQQVLLNSLGRSETDRLLTALLDGSPSDALGESLHTTTGGNPLFVEQLVLALSETGKIHQTAGVWYGTTELEGAPQIVREVIAQRLARLGRSCRETLEIAAVVGHAMDYAVLLGTVDPPDESMLLSDLDQAISASVLQETTSGYAFRHVVLRDAVYWNLSTPRRMLLHGRAGEVIERLRGVRATDNAAELAYHFTHAGEGPTVRAKALQYSIAAGRHAARLSAYPEAFAHFGQACALIERQVGFVDVDSYLEALEGRGWAEAGLARWSETTKSYRQALGMTGDPVRRARAHGLIAFTHQHTGDFSAALEECKAGLDELEGIDVPDAIGARLHLQQLIAYAWYYQGRYRDVVGLGREMEAAAAGLGQPRALVLAHSVVAWGLMGQGQVEQALQQYQRVLAASELHGEKVQLATALENLGYQHYLGGRFQAAREHLDRALSIYHASASELRAVNALQHLCRVWVAEGDLKRAREHLTRALEAENEGQERYAADGLHILATVQALQCEWEPARANFERAILIRQAVGDLGGVVESMVGIGLVYQYVGECDRARQAFADAAQIADAMDPSPVRVLAHRHLGRLRLLDADRAAAADDIELAFTLSETMPETLEHAPTLTALAELRADQLDLEQARAIAEQALSCAGTVEQLADAHVLLSTLDLALGQAESARAHVGEAICLAARLGSDRLLSVVHLAAARATARSQDVAAQASFETALAHARAARAPHDHATVLLAFAEYLDAAGTKSSKADGMRADAAQLLLASKQLTLNTN